MLKSFLSSERYFCSEPSKINILDMHCIKYLLQQNLEVTTLWLSEERCYPLRTVKNPAAPALHVLDHGLSWPSCLMRLIDGFAHLLVCCVVARTVGLPSWNQHQGLRQLQLADFCGAALFLEKETFFGAYLLSVLGGLLSGGYMQHMCSHDWVKAKKKKGNDALVINRFPYFHLFFSSSHPLPWTPLTPPSNSVLDNHSYNKIIMLHCCK